MLSGGNPASVKVSRNGPWRLFQVGTLRPSLSLPSPVSTTMRCDGVSTTSAWIDIFRRPSSVAKSGMSQGNFRISSLVASGRINLVLPTVSNSTTFVILTRPTFHRIPRFLVGRRAFRSQNRQPLGSSPKARLCGISAVVSYSKDADFHRHVQWTIFVHAALWGNQPHEELRDAGTCDFARKSRLFDREGAGIRREGCAGRSRFWVERRGRRHDRRACGQWRRSRGARNHRLHQRADRGRADRLGGPDASWPWRRYHRGRERGAAPPLR